MQTKAVLNAMPVAYARPDFYIFGTVGLAILLAQIGPKLLGIDLEAACKAYEATTRRHCSRDGRKRRVGLASLGLSASRVSCPNRWPCCLPNDGGAS